MPKFKIGETVDITGSDDYVLPKNVKTGVVTGIHASSNGNPAYNVKVEGWSKYMELFYTERDLSKVRPDIYHEVKVFGLTIVKIRKVVDYGG